MTSEEHNKKSLTSKEKEKIVIEYLPLVKKIAKSLIRNNTDPIEDLIQVGCIGLLEAATRYKMGHKASFKTYATHFINGHIRHYLRDKQTLLRGPRALQELSYRLNTLTKKLTQELGRQPDSTEIAQYLGIPVNKVDEIRVYDQRVTIMWLDQEINESDTEDSRFLIDTISSETDTEEKIDIKILLRDALSKLPPLQKELLEFRYLHDFTQIELSKKFNISQMEVCRRLKMAERQLKNILRNQ